MRRFVLVVVSALVALWWLVAVDAARGDEGPRLGGVAVAPSPTASPSPGHSTEATPPPQDGVPNEPTVPPSAVSSGAPSPAPSASPSPLPSPSPSAASSPSPSAAPSPSPSAVAPPSPKPPAAPSPQTFTPARDPRPALASNTGLRVEAVISYRTRTEKQVSQGEAVWVYEVPRLYPAVSNGRFTLYVAKEGRWIGVGRAAGSDLLENGKKSDWYYAFSETYPLDRPNPVVPGVIGNLTVQLYGGRGPVRYRFDAGGNGGAAGATRDVFPIERHIGAGRTTEVERMAIGWPPVLRIGAIPGEPSSTDFSPSNAMAGQIALVKPQALTGNRRLSGTATWKQRYKGTEYVVRLRWASK